MVHMRLHDVYNVVQPSASGPSKAQILRHSGESRELETWYFLYAALLAIIGESLGDPDTIGSG